MIAEDKNKIKRKKGNDIRCDGCDRAAVEASVVYLSNGVAICRIILFLFFFLLTCMCTSYFIILAYFLTLSFVKNV